MDEDAHRRTLPAPPLDSDATYIPVRPGAGAAPSPDPRSTLARLDPRGGSTLPAAGPPRALTEQPWAPYQVLGELGRGGMGLVYRARQKELGREVALKQVISERPELHQKFLLEARLTGQLEHPNIVPVYDLLRGVEGEVALAMKLVHGREWSAILRPAAGEAPRDLDFHLGVLLSVSNAVGFAHSRGVTHNDLKPANVMVGEFGEVLLMDWGIAYDVRELPEPPLAAPHRSTMDGASGTPVYMAPELAMGDGSRLGPWTDVYLLGAILFEIVTGAPPHTGEDVGQVIRAAVLSEPKPFPPGAPRGLEAICHKAMARDPDHRYPDVKSLQEALRGFLKTRESNVISTAAAATLQRAQAAVAGGRDETERSRLYGEFAEAANAFRQALVLWSENPEAREGEHTAYLALARLALRHGDLGLAEAQASRLPEQDPERRALLESIAATSLSRARAGRATLRLRRALLGTALAFVAGLALSVIAVRNEQQRAQGQAELAEGRLADIHRLADVKRLADLLARAEELYPAAPQKVPALESFLVEARPLLSRLAGHRDWLARLKARNDRSPPTAEALWEQETLSTLVAQLSAFETGTLRDVERRLAFAQTVEARTIGERKAQWAELAAAVAASPRYGGLKLLPQLGLVPLGVDPASGLLEFAHLESGEIPVRDAAGKLQIHEDSAVVLVLLPGGKFHMGTAPASADHPAGSANVDPEARSEEGPIHEVTLDPYFFGKYELTQAQWQRATGANSSAYVPGRVVGERVHDGRHPVEQVNWEEVTRTLTRLALTLPTEAQWEYAARGGTTTRYFTGTSIESLQGAANLADRYCKEHGGPGSWLFETGLDDGYVVHAPVGSFRPNPFGIHDTTGNVWEWCVDRYGPYTLPVKPGTGERIVLDEKIPRLFRGGGFRSNAVHARSADRYSLYAPNFRGFDIGARAARLLETGAK